MNGPKENYSKHDPHKFIQADSSFSLPNDEAAIYLTTGDAYTLGVSKCYEEFTNLSLETVVGHNMKDLEEKGVIDRSATLLALKSNKKVTIIQKILGTGKKVVASSTPIFDHHGKITFVASIVAPYTDKREETVIATSLFNPFSTVEGLVYKSEKMQQVLFRAAQAASTDATVLLMGESGVGKEVVAKIIHQLSHRSKKPFITVNMAAIPNELFESELFGYQPGAFTGASKSGKVGLVEAAQGGTLFLDEISEIPLNIQAKMLRLLQDKELFPIGSMESTRVDVRFLAASNKDLPALVREGKFREDLFYRLDVIPIHIPPLRERKEDIDVLADFFLNELCSHYHVKKYFTLETLEVLRDYPWPGNVRELRNFVERIVVLRQEQRIDEKCVYEEFDRKLFSSTREKAANNYPDLHKAVEYFERDFIKQVLNACGNNLEDTARFLKIHRTTLIRKLKRHNMLT